MRVFKLTAFTDLIKKSQQTLDQFCSPLGAHLTGEVLPIWEFGASEVPETVRMVNKSTANYDGPPTVHPHSLEVPPCPSKLTRWPVVEDVLGDVRGRVVGREGEVLGLPAHQDQPQVHLGEERGREHQTQPDWRALNPTIHTDPLRGFPQFKHSLGIRLDLKLAQTLTITAQDFS